LTGTLPAAMLALSLALGAGELPLASGQLTELRMRSPPLGTPVFRTTTFSVVASRQVKSAVAE
jgi:hypothetical protein